MTSLLKGLVGAWLLGDTATDGATVRDLTGNSHGTIDNSSGDILKAVTRQGVALDFSGDDTNDRVDLGSIISSNPLSLAGKAEFTIVYGAMIQASDTWERIIDKSDGGNGANGWAIYLGKGSNLGLAVSVGGNSIASPITTAPIHVANKYHNYAATVEINYRKAFTTLGGNTYYPRSPNDRITAFRDGVQVAQDVSGTAFSEPPTTTVNAAIGNWNHSTSRMLDGVLSYVYVYNRLLSDSEIMELHVSPYIILTPRKIWVPSDGTPLELIAKLSDSRWNIRQNIGDVIHIGWNIRQNIGDDSDLRWNIRQNIGDIIHIGWNIINLIGKASDIRYDMRNLVDDNLNVQWDVVNDILKSSNISWNIANLIGKASDIRYDMRNLVDDNLNLQWDMSGLIDKVTDLRWHLLNFVGDDINAQWHVNNFISKLVDHRWDILNDVIIPLDLRWDMMGIINKVTDLRWHLLNFVGDDINAQWHVNNFISKLVDHRWNILNDVITPLDLRWDMRNIINKPVDNRWDILNNILKPIDHRWNILNDVIMPLDLRWNMMGIINKPVDNRWDILNDILKPIDLRWDILSDVIKLIDLRWDMRNIINKPVDHRWDILNDILKPIDLRWDMEGIINKSVDYRWNVLNYIWDSVELRGVIRNFQSSDIELQHNIRNLLQNAIDLQNNIRVIVGDTSEIRWDSAGDTKKTLEMRWDNVRDRIRDQADLSSLIDSDQFYAVDQNGDSRRVQWVNLKEDTTLSDNIETVNISTQVNIDFTANIDNTYDIYEIVIEGGTVATDTADIELLITDDAGSSFENAAGDYDYSSYTLRSASGFVFDGNDNAAHILIANSVGNGSGEGYKLKVRIHNPAVRGIEKQIIFESTYLNDAGNVCTVRGGGTFKGNTNAINGFRLTLSNGNFVAGTAYIRGLKL